MEFPQVLLELKKKNGYTNAYIGNACGVSESAVRTWLSGKKTPSSAALKSLSLLFNVSTDYLLGNEEKTPADADVTFDDFTYALYNESKELSDADKEMLLEMARFFKQRLNEEKNNK